MQSKRPDEKVFYAVFVALLCLHVILIVTARLYPFIDLPNHLTEATIYRHFEDGSNRFSSYFTLDLFLKPNIFHMLFCSLPVFGSVEIANRIFFCLYAVLLPVSVLLLIVKLDGNRWFSLLSLLLLYNINVSWGFVGFVFAVPLVLLFMHSAIDFIEMGHWGAGLVAAMLLVLIFFVHVLAALFSLLVFLVYCILSGKQPVYIIERCAALAPAAALILFWWDAEGAAYRGLGLERFLGDYYAHRYVQTLPGRLAMFYQDNRHLFAGGGGVAAGILFALCIIAPVLAAVVLRKVRGRSGRSRPIRPALVFFCCSLACVLLLPRKIPQQHLLYERFLPVLYLSAILLGGCLLRGRLSRAAVIGICAACVLHFALWADYLVDFNRENRSFTAEFMPPAEEGRTLAGLVWDYTYRGSPVYIHFPGYYTVWRRGIATTSVIDYRFGTVKRAVGLDELPKYLEWAGKFEHYDDRYSNMDYILVRGDFPVREIDSLVDFTLRRTAGAWSLYERNR